MLTKASFGRLLYGPINGRLEAGTRPSINASLIRLRAYNPQSTAVGEGASIGRMLR